MEIYWLLGSGTCRHANLACYVPFDSSWKTEQNGCFCFWNFENVFDKIDKNENRCSSGCNFCVCWPIPVIVALAYSCQAGLSGETVFLPIPATVTEWWIEKWLIFAYRLINEFSKSTSWDFFQKWLGGFCRTKSRLQNVPGANIVGSNRHENFPFEWKVTLLGPVHTIFGCVWCA